MNNSTKKQKEFLNYLFLKKFKLMSKFDDIDVPALEGDNKKCYGIVHTTIKNSIQTRINDVDQTIDRYLESMNE